MNSLITAGNTNRRNVRKVDYLVAKQYFFAQGYICSSFQLPDIFKASGFETLSLDTLAYTRTDPPNRTKAINLYTPKGLRSWRRFSLVHPYAYWHLVDEITAQTNWDNITKILSTKNNITCYSLPKFNSKQKMQAVGIKAWIKFAENDVIKDSPEYTFLVVTDIKNFYPSIYTHSISWAIEGKDKAKGDKKYKLSGNKIDKLFQNSRGGQTNGIPVGNAISDLMSEVILCRIDGMLTQKLKKLGIDYCSGRYRDDYKFLCNSRADGEQILKVLNRLLHEEYDLSMNEEKTEIYDDIIKGSQRPWITEYKNSYTFNELKKVSPAVNVGILKDLLLETYRIQSNHPATRSGITLLNQIILKIDKTKDFKSSVGDIEYCIALVRKIMLLREEVTPHGMLLIDKLLSYQNQKSKEALLSHMHTTFSKKEDWEYQEVWLYRLYLHHCPNLIKTVFKKSRSPLIKMLLSSKKKDFLFYETIDQLSANDTKELKKFSLIDRKVLSSSSKQPISIKSINAFSYPA